MRRCTEPTTIASGFPATTLPPSTQRPPLRSVRNTTVLHFLAVGLEGTHGAAILSGAPGPRLQQRYGVKPPASDELVCGLLVLAVLDQAYPLDGRFVPGRGGGFIRVATATEDGDQDQERESRPYAKAHVMPPGFLRQAAERGGRSRPLAFQRLPPIRPRRNMVPRAFHEPAPPERASAHRPWTPTPAALPRPLLTQTRRSPTWRCPT